MPSPAASVSSGAASSRAAVQGVIVIYTLAALISALLLFLVQPMFARMTLPLLGGSPAVWNTAMVFYQAALLGGYAYAHAATHWLGARRQALLHVALLLLPLLVLPIALPRALHPPTSGTPVWWLLGVMAFSVGLPFFVVSASSPLLQKWLASSGHPTASNPYFLYAASNCGSMLALLGYPVVVEPHLRLGDQSRYWSWGYGVFVLAMMSCALVLWRSQAANQQEARPDEPEIAAPIEPISLERRARWVVLAFVPSSLMLSVTTYLSTDIAAIPLLWVVPLSLYLLTFIFVFADKPWSPQAWSNRALPILLVPLCVTVAVRATQPLSVMVPLHLGTFFVAALVCHGELARLKPAAAHLTEFFLWMSLGGVLGGVFNALVAPMLFTSIAEYPLALALCAMLLNRPAFNTDKRSRILDLILPVLLGLLTVLLIATVNDVRASGLWATAWMFGVPALWAFSFSRRPLRLGLALGAMLLAGSFYLNGTRGVAFAERSFFGLSRVLVEKTSAGRFHVLAHGGIVHGRQSLEPAHRREPLTYYARTGPLGQVFDMMQAKKKLRVGAVGLGAGTVAAYARPGEQWTFYEIDPVVQKLARDPKLFTYLSDCRAPVQIIPGDARLSLQNAPDASYDLIILDAYSGDSIPLHLATREALRLYLRKLAPHGIVAYHITNQHLDLQPVVGLLAADANLVCRARHDRKLSDGGKKSGKVASQWAVVARRPEDLGALMHDPKWQPARQQPGLQVWTDDYSSLLSVFKWK